LNESTITRIGMPAIVSGTRRFDVMTGEVFAPGQASYEDLCIVPKLQLDMLTKKLAISSDRNSDEAIAVVYLMKMKMQAGLNGLDQNGICCLCDFEDDGSVVLQAMACVRAVIVLLSSGTLASAQQLAVGA